MRAQISMLKFWDRRIRNMEDDALVKLAYKENLESNSTWCKTIQVLNTAYQLHTKNWTQIQFQNEVKKTITKDFISHWRSRIDDPGVEKKLQLYSKVTEGFKIGDYLDIPHSVIQGQFPPRQNLKFSVSPLKISSPGISKSELPPHSGPSENFSRPTVE